MAPALAALQADQRPEEMLRGTLEMNTHANSLGLTTVMNNGNFPDLEFPLQLWREERLTIRMRPLYPANTPEAEARILNTSATAAARSATICSASPGSASASAATTRPRTCSSRPRA